MKLTDEERRRIRLHHIVAPPIPKRKPIRSMRGQRYMSFEELSREAERPSEDPQEQTGDELKN